MRNGEDKPSAGKGSGRTEQVATGARQSAVDAGEADSLKPECPLRSQRQYRLLHARPQGIRVGNPRNAAAAYCPVDGLDTTGGSGMLPGGRLTETSSNRRDGTTRVAIAPP